MSKLHELLAVEATVGQQAGKLLQETQAKFGNHSQFFLGTTRTLSRLKDSAEDKAIEQAARAVKELPTNVPETIAYVMPHLRAALDIKLSKHATNQIAQADIVMDGKTVMREVPVDFLLDLEKQLPMLRTMFQQMPTLDPSSKWVKEREGVYKLESPKQSSQTSKEMFPVIMSPATLQHPAQVKESSRDITVGIFSEMIFSGAATAQQKADVLALCDSLLTAVKQARMRANSVEIVKPADSAKNIVELFSAVFA